MVKASAAIFPEAELLTVKNLKNSLPRFDIIQRIYRSGDVPVFKVEDIDTGNPRTYHINRLTVVEQEEEPEGEKVLHHDDVCFPGAEAQVSEIFRFARGIWLLGEDKMDPSVLQDHCLTKPPLILVD